jgi:hypothetical protein
VGKAPAGPDGQFYSRLQSKEGHGPMFELLADYPFRCQAETIVVEAERTLQVVNGDGNDGNAWFHETPPLG